MKLRLAVAALLLAGPAGAYYHFVHYVSGSIAVEKFDLNALPSKTVTFLVSENGPTTFNSTDSLNSVLAQIRQAAAIWNGVSTSDLRVAFGGFENAATVQGAPGGDIVFDDLPPGVEGFGGPVSKASAVTNPDGSVFFPVQRAAIHLNRNLAVAPGPSYNQSFLMTTLHEMGHALGLQHTFTSSTMSQATTRATTIAHPLDSDDIAGISTLYPNAGAQAFGSISGQVTSGGQGIHLASVVAIRAGAGAVSALTSTDGSYRIDGVPPGQYQVYVHSLPPDANILGPYNADGSVAAASGAINTVFYNSASSVTASAGAVTSGINFAVTGRSSVPVYDGQIFTFFGSNAVYPAPVNLQTSGILTLVASVIGLGSNGQSPGLAVQITGSDASIRSNGVRPYQQNGYTYVALDLNLNANGKPGPQHLIFTTPDYTYVLPSAIYLTQGGPPQVTAVAANPDGTISITGSGWNAGTSLYFDSLPAPIASIDTVNGVAVVNAPAGFSGQQATISAVNPDGQNSTFLAGPAVQYSYGNLISPAVTAVSPASLPAGSEAMIDITTSGFSFGSGNISLGFGTSDVIVRKVFVAGPNHLQANVSVSGAAALSATDLTVMSDFALATGSSAFGTIASVTGQPEPVPTLTNSIVGLNGAYPGAQVVLNGSALSTGSSSAITIGGISTQVLVISPNEVTLTLPQSLTPGPTALVVNNGKLSSFPVLVNIDPLPSPIVAVQTPDGTYLSPSQPAHLGNTVIVTLQNFGSSGSTIAASRIQISLGGVSHPAASVAQSAGFTQVSFQIGSGDPTSPDAIEELVVYLDGHSSYPAYIPVLP